MQSSGSPSRHSVTGTERVGPYTLLRLERGGLDPGVPGQFFMLKAPGRVKSCRRIADRQSILGDLDHRRANSKAPGAVLLPRRKHVVAKEEI